MLPNTNYSITQTAGSVEYTDCFSEEGKNLPTKQVSEICH